MKLILFAVAVVVLGVGDLAHATDTSKPVAKSAASASKAKPISKHGVALDASTAKAPHRYPASARKLPDPKPLKSNSSSNAGTVHKDAPLDQIAGAGG